jgi:hypothetical protein
MPNEGVLAYHLIITAYGFWDGSFPSPWARKWWKVFLDDEEDILRAIRYVERNPRKEGKPPQRWSFVVPYPFHRLRV